MAHDAFISYSSKDKPVADAVVAALEARGVRCWVAPRDIAPGSDYGAAIIEGINGSRVMVLIFSANSNSSPQVIREVERAVNKQLHIIPFRIEPAEMTKAMEYYISSPHWLDAITPPMDAHIDRLAGTVRAVIGDAAARPPIIPAAPRTEPVSPRATPPRRSPAVFVGVVIGAFAIATTAALLWHRSHRGATGLAGGAQPPSTAVSPTTAPTPASVVVRSSDALLALPAKDGLVRKLELSVDDESGSVGRIFLSPDATRLVVGPHDNEEGYPTAAAWDTISGRPLFRVKGVKAVAVSQDVRRVFIASRLGGRGVTDVSTGARLCALESPGQGVVAAVSHDGQTVAVGAGQKLTLFNTETGSKVRELASAAAEGYLWRAEFSPDDQTLLLASASATQVECLNRRTGVVLWAHEASVPRSMTQFAASAPRVRVARDRTWVLDARDGKPLLDLDLSWNETIVELSPDGGWLVGTDRTGNASPIRLWSVDDKQELNRFHGVSLAKPTMLKFSPDGRRLLAGTGDGKLIVLDLATGKQVAELKGSPSAIYDISLSADGRFAATNGGDGNIAWLWRLPE